MLNFLGSETMVFYLGTLIGLGNSVSSWRIIWALNWEGGNIVKKNILTLLVDLL